MHTDNMTESTASSSTSLSKLYVEWGYCNCWTAARTGPVFPGHVQISGGYVRISRLAFDAFYIDELWLSQAKQSRTPMEHYNQIKGVFRKTTSNWHLICLFSLSL